MKEMLNGLVNEKSVAESRSTISLVLAVLLKYGIAPLACIYFAWLITQKDDAIQKNNDTLVVIVREQTTATIQNTAAVQNLNTLIQTIEIERRAEKRSRN